MSSKKNNNKKSKDNNNEIFNIAIIVVTSVIVITLICVTIIVSKSRKNTESNTANSTNVSQNANSGKGSAPLPQGGVAPNSPDEISPEEMIKSYESDESGIVSEKDSKTYSYFMSHYQDDYYRVNEIAYSIIVDGSYTEYYETETVAYSTQGYLYNKKVESSYEEQDYASPIVQLYTPTNSYIIYPDMESYFAGNQTTQNYKNTVDFPGDSFKTGTININGRDYYYEETTDESGISFKYCFDNDNDLRFTIASSPMGTITTRHVEYSKDVDYSLFEIPEHYVLQQ